MKKLKQYIYKKRKVKFLNHPIRERRFVDYEHAKTILLLFESDYIEKNRFIRQAIDQLISDGKKVFAWGFLDKKMTTTAILPTFKILDRQTVDFTGRPKETLLKELMDVEYDMLIDLTLNDTLPLQYACLYANAAIKTGMSRTMDNVLDFVIKVPLPEGIEDVLDEAPETKEDTNEFLDLNESLFHEGQQFLFDQIIFYLKNIRSKDENV